MGLLDKIKQDAQRSGSNKGKFFYVKEGDKRRVRFLSDMEDGFEVTFHDSFEASINVPCQEIFGRSCQYCDEDGLRTRTQYAWSVWDYEANEVKIFMYPMNNCSPVGALASMYETYGTLLDRDYMISVTGKQQNKTFTVVPMDKNKFRNGKAKALSKQKFLDVLDKAYPDEHAGEYEDDEPKMKSKKNASKKKVEVEEIDYSEMSAKELYNLCEERDIEAEPKMKAQYYIDLLKEADEADTDDLPWEEPDEDTSDYSEMSAKELYKLCQERDIEALPRKPEKYYINLLEENDKAHDDWDEDSEKDEDDWDE